MKVAAIQHDIHWESPADNFVALDREIRTAAAAGAKLIALPELFSYGFSMATESIAESPDGPSTTFLRALAAELGVWLAGSIPERSPGAELPYNTLIVVGPDDEIERYRKIHPFSHGGENRHYLAGSEHVVVRIEEVRLALFICYDLRFGDEFWTLAPRVDAYLVVANWPLPRSRHWRALLRARAIENQAYVIGVNRVGDGGGLTYRGDSCILDPMGATLAEAAWQPATVCAEIDPAEVARIRSKLPFLRDRRSGHL